MRVNKSQLWIVGTALTCTVIVLAGWFLLISPKRAEAADLRTQTESATQVNAQLELLIAQLKADFVELPQRKAELAAIKRAMPEQAQLAVLTRDVQALSTSSGVTLMSIAPGGLTAVVPELAPAVAVPADGESSSAPTVVALPADTGLSSLAVTIDVTGSFEDAEAFLEGVQAEMDRRFLVDGLSIRAETAAEAGGGKPAVANGDVTFIVTGRVFVLAPVVPVAEVPLAGTDVATN